MLESTPRKSSWVIYLLSAVLFFLFAWLFAFIIDDLGDVSAPNHSKILHEHVAPDLIKERRVVEDELRAVNTLIGSTRASLENAKSALGADFEVKSFQFAF